MMRYKTEAFMYLAAKVLDHFYIKNVLHKL